MYTYTIYNTVQTTTQNRGAGPELRHTGWLYRWTITLGHGHNGLAGEPDWQAGRRRKSDRQTPIPTYIHAQHTYT